MALRDLLICIDPTAAGDARLKLAFNLARANGAHLTGAYAMPEADGGRSGPSGFGGVPSMAHRSEFHSILRREGVDSLVMAL
jgi:hypothetical protein